MTAYLGLQDPAYNRLLKQSEQSTGQVANENAAPSQAVAEQWVQLSNKSTLPLGELMRWTSIYNLQAKHAGNGFETWRLIQARCSIPLGTRSIRYLTRLLKPQLDEQKCEESFTTCEFQLPRYEQDNNTLLPDAVKIAILLKETKGPQQQHLQLQAGNITTYAQIRSMVIEYYRATASFTRLQPITSGSNTQGPAPMDIGATWYNKGKGKKGKHKGKGKYNKGKGYGNYGNNYSYNNCKGGKDKYNQQPVGQGNPKDNMDMAKEKDTATKEKAKDTGITNKEEKEQKQNKQQMFATDVGNQDTWPNSAEWRSTTVTQESLTPMTSTHLRII